VRIKTAVSASPSKNGERKLAKRKAWRHGGQRNGMAASAWRDKHQA